MARMSFSKAVNSSAVCSPRLAAASLNAAAAPMASTARRHASGAMAGLRVAAASSSSTTGRHSPNTPASNSSSTKAPMSRAVSAMRPGTVSLRSRSISSCPDRRRTLSCPSVSSHSSISGGRPRAARSAARVVAWSIDWR